VNLLNDKGASSEEIQSFFVKFLDGVLKESSESYRFDYSHLDSNGVISTLNETETFGTDYRVEMDGVSYYLDEGPTKEALVQSLSVYFSFWGAADLEDYLESNGLDGAEVVSISIDGEPVSFLSNVRDEESEQEQEKQKQDTQNVFENIFTNDDGEVSKPVVISIYSGVVVFAVLVALIVFRHRVGQRRLAESNGNNLDATGDEENDVQNNLSKTIPTAVSKETSTDPKLGSTGASRTPKRKSKIPPKEVAKAEDLSKDQSTKNQPQAQLPIDPPATSGGTEPSPKPNTADESSPASQIPRKSDPPVTMDLPNIASF